MEAAQKVEKKKIRARIQPDENQARTRWQPSYRQGCNQATTT